MNNKSIFIKCSCGSEGILVSSPDYDGYTDLAFFRQCPTDRSWKNRIKLALACLKGKPYGDQVLLDRAAVRQLEDFLFENKIDNSNKS